MMLLALQMAPGSPDPFPVVNTPAMEYIEMLLVLGGVLAFAYLTLRFGLPRFFGLRAPAGGPIQMVSRYPLEPKKSLYLVRVGSEVFLLATAEGQVEYLTAIARENAAEILESARQRQPQPKDFRQILNWVQKTGKADC
jgi:flagellar biogenesis protein FliO